MTYSIYILTFATGEKYIGMTSNFKQRLGMHVVHLNRGDHHQATIQKCWDEQGLFDASIVFTTECKRTALDHEKHLQKTTVGSVHSTTPRKHGVSQEDRKSVV